MIEYLLMKSVTEFYNPWIGVFGDKKFPSNNRPFPVVKLAAGHVVQITETLSVYLEPISSSRILRNLLSIGSTL